MAPVSTLQKISNPSARSPAACAELWEKYVQACAKAKQEKRIPDPPPPVPSTKSILSSMDTKIDRIDTAISTTLTNENLTLVVQSASPTLSQIEEQLTKVEFTQGKDILDAIDNIPTKTAALFPSLQPYATVSSVATLAKSVTNEKQRSDDLSFKLQTKADASSFESLRKDINNVPEETSKLFPSLAGYATKDSVTKISSRIDLTNKEVTSAKTSLNTKASIQQLADLGRTTSDKLETMKKALSATHDHAKKAADSRPIEAVKESLVSIAKQIEDLPSKSQSSTIARTVQDMFSKVTAAATSREVEAISAKLADISTSTEVEAISSALESTAKSSEVRAISSALGSIAKSIEVQAISSALESTAKSSAVGAISSTLESTAKSSEIEAISSILETIAKSSEMEAISSTLAEVATSSQVQALSNKLDCLPTTQITTEIQQSFGKLATSNEITEVQEQLQKVSTSQHVDMILHHLDSLATSKESEAIAAEVKKLLRLFEDVKPSATLVQADKILAEVRKCATAADLNTRIGGAVKDLATASKVEDLRTAMLKHATSSEANDILAEIKKCCTSGEANAILTEVKQQATAIQAEDIIQKLKNCSTSVETDAILTEVKLQVTSVQAEGILQKLTGCSTSVEADAILAAVKLQATSIQANDILQKLTECSTSDQADAMLAEVKLQATSTEVKDILQKLNKCSTSDQAVAILAEVKVQATSEEVKNVLKRVLELATSDQVSKLTEEIAKRSTSQQIQDLSHDIKMLSANEDIASSEQVNSVLTELKRQATSTDLNKLIQSVALLTEKFEKHIEKFNTLDKDVRQALTSVDRRISLLKTEVSTTQTTVNREIGELVKSHNVLCPSIQASNRLTKDLQDVIQYDFDVFLTQLASLATKADVGYAGAGMAKYLDARLVSKADMIKAGASLREYLGSKGATITIDPKFCGELIKRMQKTLATGTSLSIVARDLHASIKLEINAAVQTIANHHVTKTAFDAAMKGISTHIEGLNLQAIGKDLVAVKDIVVQLPITDLATSSSLKNSLLEFRTQHFDKSIEELKTAAPPVILTDIKNVLDLLSSRDLLGATAFNTSIDALKALFPDIFPLGLRNALSEISRRDSLTASAFTTAIQALKDALPKELSPELQEALAELAAKDIITAPAFTAAIDDLKHAIPKSLPSDLEQALADLTAKDIVTVSSLNSSLDTIKQSIPDPLPIELRTSLAKMAEQNIPTITDVQQAISSAFPADLLQSLQSLSSKDIAAKSDIRDQLESTFRKLPSATISSSLEKSAAKGISCDRLLAELATSLQDKLAALPMARYTNASTQLAPSGSGSQTLVRLPVEPAMGDAFRQSEQRPISAWMINTQTTSGTPPRNAGLRTSPESSMTALTVRSGIMATTMASMGLQPTGSKRQRQADHDTTVRTPTRATPKAKRLHIQRPTPTQSAPVQPSSNLGPPPHFPLPQMHSRVGSNDPFAITAQPSSNVATARSTASSSGPSSWQRYDIGDPLPKKKNPILEQSGLPITLQRLIASTDAKTKTHRSLNAEWNIGRARICWYSQYKPCKTWNPTPDNPCPATSGKASQEQRQKKRDWHEEMWRDPKTECPSCVFRKADGETDAACFYFTDSKTLYLFGPVAAEAQHVNDEEML